MLRAIDQPTGVGDRTTLLEHDCSPDCWCEPVCENVMEWINGDTDVLVWVHNKRYLC